MPALPRLAACAFGSRHASERYLLPGKRGTGTLYSSSCACGLRPRAPSHSLSTKSLVAQKQSRSVAESATRGRPSPQRTTLLLSAGLSPALAHLQNRLQQHLATHVELHHGPKRGRIEIEYYGNDDLQRLLQALGLPEDR